ncbi:MAG: hypothetical protein JXR10_06185 [Cyclobacteriaceae bacterium]
MWRIKLVCVFAILSAFQGFGQVYGNEWIDEAKSYYRIRVLEDGIYRVSASELQQAGLPVNSIAVNRYQMFRRGVEQAIIAQDDDGDGRVDYIEFYGQANDGDLDTELYDAPEAQPHKYYSLFADSSSYFLTYHLSNIDGKRMGLTTLKDITGLTPATEHILSPIQIQTNSYNAGQGYGATGEVGNPSYDFGEGWTGSVVSKNQNQAFSFVLDGLLKSGSQPVVELVLSGRSSFEHVVEVRVGPNSSELRKIGESTFEGRNSTLYRQSILWTDVSDAGELVVQVTPIGIQGQTDAITVSYVLVEYASSFSLAGDQQNFHLTSSGIEKGLLRLPTTLASQLRAFDVTDRDNPLSLSPTAYTDRLDVVFDQFTEDRDILIVNTPKSVGSIVASKISSLSVNTANYLIVFHDAMNISVDGVNPVSAYADYRGSIEGGGYDVLSVTIDQLFDQFSYGDPSPIALRRFCTYAHDQGTPTHLFIIGKGLMPEDNYYRNPTVGTNFVPTYGHPGSDLLFTVHPDQGGDINPDIAVGRYNAYNSAQVNAYLDKVKEQESTPYDDLWRKRLIHLSGGQTPVELAIFRSNLSAMERVAEGDFLGGSVSRKGKSSVAVDNLIDVTSEVNSGVSLMTFFGHSSSIVNDIEIGRASDPSEGYNNKGKYPFILINGCNAGNIFGSTFTFGEDWMVVPDKGALGVIANSEFALSSALRRWSNLFYELGFSEEEKIGMSVGELINEISSEYFERYGTDQLDKSQVYMTVLQGDPALTVLGAKQPDFSVEMDQAFAASFDKARVLASEDSFLIKVPVKNFGRTVLDSLEISVQRTLSDGTMIASGYQVQSVRYLDTLKLTIYNNESDINDGNNSFVVTLDPQNKLAELNELNNSVSFDLFIPRGSTIPLYPLAFAKIANRTPELTWQSANQLEGVRMYDLEIDTVADYSSPYLRQEIIAGGLLNRYMANLESLPDSTVVYWRTRFEQAEANEDTSWVTQSFTLLPDSQTGWIQSSLNEIGQNEFNRLTLNDQTGEFAFNQTSTTLSVNTHGSGHPNGYESYAVIVDGINLLATDNAADPRCKKLNAINAVVFDKESSQPIRPLGISGSDVSNDLVCGRLPQMIHNFSENEVLGSARYLEQLINAMDNGDMILLFSFDSVAYANWDAAVRTSLNSVGISEAMIDGLIAGQPVIFLGRKGDQAGTAQMVTAEEGGVVDVKDQAISFVGEASGRFTSGSIEQSLVGPAKSWKDFNISVSKEDGDDWFVNLVGVSKTGEENPIVDAISNEQIDISSLDAAAFPFLKIDLQFSDNLNQTPPRLNRWAVNYDTPPEGILIPAMTESIELDEGAEFVGDYSYVNISDVPFEEDSVSVSAVFTNSSSGNQSVQEFLIASPALNDSSHFQVNQNSRSFAGENTLAVKVTSMETEQYTQNNAVIIPNAMNVIGDDTNPVLDVTFDGSYILDGDIVSPNPNILILFKDENEYLLKDDTTGIVVELKSPCETCVYERVNFTDPRLSYNVAFENNDFEITYSPGPLEDGIHSLRVQGEDANGNQSGVQPYEISFEVINKSSITHFYPYPNPFSTNTRFVFTLTGSSIPDQIKIQIMTVSGRVVREITQDEIGPIKIGNNVSQYGWDGKDEYGDQLANGVYLYKVFLRQNGESIDHRNTSADRAFKNGFGKIYLLR